MRELHAHCYRMLGSTHDAEDALQDAMLDAWRGVASFQGRSSLRSWLYTVTANACLKLIRRRPKRVLPDRLRAARQPPRCAPRAARRVRVDRALPGRAAALRRARDGRAGIRRRASAPACAPSVGIDPPRRPRVLGPRGGRDPRRDTAGDRQRPPARAPTVDERLPEQSQQAALSELDDERLREFVDGYINAWENADVDALVTLLAEDAAVAMPPEREWYAGREAVGAFLGARPLSGRVRWRVVPTRANGQLAFAHYRFDADEGAYRLGEICVLMPAGDRIKEITAFRAPAAFACFDLPETLGGGRRGNA